MTARILLAPESTTASSATTTSSVSTASTTKVVRLELLTESRAEVAERCKREEKLRYVDGLIPRTIAEGMRFGTLGHHALEAWWKACTLDPPIGNERLVDAIMAARTKATPASDAFEVAKLEALLEGYDARWGAEQFEVLGVELEFRAPLVNPATGAPSRTFERAGKMDVVARQAGRVVIIEHKFPGEDIAPGSVFWSTLRIAGQSSGYIRGAESLGYRDVAGVIYDAVRRPALEPLKATPVEQRKYTKATKTEPSRLYANQRERDETVDEYRNRVRADIAENPDKYYQRGTVVRLERDLLEHDGERWFLGQTLREHHRLGLAPRTVGACRRYGSMCSYFPLCCGEASADDYARAEWAHPELSQNPKEEG